MRADREKHKSASRSASITQSQWNKRPLVNSQLATAKREIDAEEAARMDTNQQIPVSIDVGTIAQHGFYVANINYGGLGTFTRVTFNSEPETKSALHWLDAVGAHP